MNQKLKEKIFEALSSVVPVTCLVLFLCLTISPIPIGTLSLFLAGAVLLIIGMGLFSLGADMAMMPMGQHIGAHITKSRRLWVILLVCFAMGALITTAEPDLQVLAEQIPSVPNMVIICSVALGVGVFLVLAFLRILFQKKLSTMLILFYAIVFILAIFTSDNYLAVAFDSGGVTTGPITVPFIMALGIGLAAVRGDKQAEDDSFGLVALCSIGPILAVMVMGIFYPTSSDAYTPVLVPEVLTSRDIGLLFLHHLPATLKEVAVALLPIIVFFAVFQLVSLRLPIKQLAKMGIGLVYTFVGLVLFLAGVEVGFMPAGNLIGKAVASLSYGWILIPIGMIIGYFIVKAEPAVHVLNQQVEDITAGKISKRAMMFALSVGMAVSVGLAMLRVYTGLSIWYCLVPGYLTALTLSFFVPPIFTAVAFDSGGVASGPMTATFLLPFAMGACDALGGNIMTDAFGIVAMVAMTPLITIQIMGLVYTAKEKKHAKEELPVEESSEIIDL